MANTCFQSLLSQRVTHLALRMAAVTPVPRWGLDAGWRKYVERRIESTLAFHCVLARLTTINNAALIRSNDGFDTMPVGRYSWHIPNQ